MNIAEAFVDWLEDLGVGILGQNIYIGLAPSSNKVQDNIYWVVASGGTVVSETVTGESLKDYTLDLYYRSTGYKDIYDTLYGLEQSINCNGCLNLEGLEVVSVKATQYPADEDLDSEDRKIGLLQISLSVFANCTIEVS